MTPTPEAPACARHPDRPATGTCERCGNFTCDECSVQRTSHCPACRDLAGVRAFPFRRDDWSFDRLWSYCWSAFGSDWLMLSVAVLIFFMASMVIGGFAGAVRAPFQDSGWAGIGISYVLSQLITTVALGIFEMGIYRIYLDTLEGRKVDLGRMFSQTSQLGRFVVQRLFIFALVGVPVLVVFGGLAFVAYKVSGLSPTDFVPSAKSSSVLDSDGAAKAFLVLGLGVLVLLFPLLYVTLPLQFATGELVVNTQAAPIETIRNCYAIARGQRLTILAFALLQSLIAFVGMLACCVGLLPAAALAQLLTAALFLSLRNGSEVATPGPG